MTKTREPDALRRFREEFAAFVHVAEFHTPTRPVWTGKWHILRSTRDSSWKRDVLQFSWRTHPWPVCSLGADWSVPRGTAHLLASTINPSYWRRGSSDSRVPTGILALVTEPRWRADLLEDTRAALEWFETCSTKSGALADLIRADRNGPGVATDAFKYIVAYVDQHAPR